MPDKTKLDTFRKIRTAGATTDAQQADLDHADNVYGEGWWMTVNDRRWREHADRVAELVRAHGFEMGMGAGVGERLWLGVQRAAARSTVRPLAADRREYLDRVAPGWQENERPTMERWRGRLDAAVEFKLEHGRWPCASEGTEVAERRIGVWVAAQRARKGKRDQLAAREAELDARLPGWRTARLLAPTS